MATRLVVLSWSTLVIRSSYEVAVHLYRYSTNFPKGGAWSEASLRPLLKRRYTLKALYTRSYYSNKEAASLQLSLLSSNFSDKAANHQVSLPIFRLSVSCFLTYTFSRRYTLRSHKTEGLPSQNPTSIMAASGKKFAPEAPHY